ncbi:5'-nucleotidase C-terminal domain-containing protein [Streptosporangium sp. V21-05]|uniref:5'-nucleotidase C-terminal domain-containing protein n=1 Tax=Streptosporangium sp. V21-05 TaxID=3446115 RepID=UPI003F53BFAC
MAVVVMVAGAFVPAAHAAPGQAVFGTGSAALAQDDPVRNPVGKATILFERTTASKCPVTFRIHGSFEGLPDDVQLVRYRVVGTEKWRSVKAPAGHGGAFTAVLQTFTWDWETAETSVQIEIKQPDGLVSNVLHYFKCGSPGEDETFGETTGNIGLTASGGPLAELVADAYVDAVQALSGAEVALVSRYGFHTDLDAGPVTSEELWATQSAGLAVDVHAMTGAQLKNILAYPNPQGWVLTPSAALRYTLEGGAVTEMTLNGVPVTDTQVIKIAANYILMGGWQGFPRWEGTTSVYHGGPDDMAALASYLVKNSPVNAPAGDRVTVR